MWRLVLFCAFILIPNTISKKKTHEDDLGDSGDLGGKLVAGLRDDLNLDLSVDDDYEDLRAELLAYHTALATLANRSDALPSARRSMKSTPCWERGGICVHHKLCTGYRMHPEINACRNNLEVCCFAWNKFQLTDFRDKGIDILALPWSIQREFGGKGVLSSLDQDYNGNGYRKSNSYLNVLRKSKIRNEKSPPIIFVLRGDKKK